MGPSTQFRGAEANRNCSTLLLDAYAERTREPVGALAIERLPLDGELRCPLAEFACGPLPWAGFDPEGRAAAPYEDVLFLAEPFERDG